MIPLAVQKSNETLHHSATPTDVALPVRNPATLDLCVLASQTLQQRLAQDRAGRNVDRGFDRLGLLRWRKWEWEAERYVTATAVAVGETGFARPGEEVFHNVHCCAFEDLESV